MLSIFAVAFGLAMIIMAIAADRASRAQRPLRAILLNLCGIGCLLAGLFVIYEASNPGRGARTVERGLRVAAADPNGQGAVVVPLLVGHDAPSHRGPEHTGRNDHSAEPASLEAEQAESEEREDARPEASRELAGAESTEGDTPPIKLQGESPRMQDEQAQVQVIPDIEHAEIDFAARPPWVDQPDRDVGQVHQICVTAGPYKQLRVARQQLWEQLRAQTDAYINDVLGHPQAARWVGYDKNEVRHRFVAPDRIYDEKVLSPSVGLMHQSHALLEFGPDFHEEIQQSWHHVLARARLVKVALVSAAVLGTLVLLFGYFNAETATRGFYSGRLKFATALAILAVVAVGVLVARSIPWLWL